MKKVVLASLALGGVSLAAAESFAAVNYGVAGSAYTQNFDSLSNITDTSAPGYTWTNDVTLPGWEAFKSNNTVVGGTPTAVTDYFANNGGSNAPRLWSWGSFEDGSLVVGKTERALGSLSRADTTATANDTFWNSAPGTVSGYYGIKITNTTGAALDTFQVTYDVEQWRTAGVAAQPLVVEWAINPTDWFSTFNSGASTNSPITSGVGALDGNAAANRVAGVTFGSNVTIAPGDTIWVRFREFNEVGVDHSLAVDNFSFTASVIPEPSALALAGISALLIGRRRR